jgi:hypothetical protein
MAGKANRTGAGAAGGATVRPVARGTEFTSGDLTPLEPLFAKLGAPPGRFERLTKSYRWVSAKPASGAPEVSVDVGIEPRVLNLVVTTTAGGFEPGAELVPILGQRGVTTPRGWQLMADVGWVIGWRAPGDAGPEAVMRFGLEVVRGLRLEPDDGRWSARFEARPPRPGWQSKR